MNDETRLTTEPVVDVRAGPAPEDEVALPEGWLAALDEYRLHEKLPASVAFAPEPAHLAALRRFAAALSTINWEQYVERLRREYADLPETDRPATFDDFVCNREDQDTVDGARRAWVESEVLTYYADLYRYVAARLVNREASAEGEVVVGLERVVGDVLAHIRWCEDNDKEATVASAMGSLAKRGHREAAEAPFVATAEPRATKEPKPPREPDRADPDYLAKEVLGAIKERQKSHGAQRGEHRGRCCSVLAIRDLLEKSKPDVERAVKNLLKDKKIENMGIRFGRPCYVIKEI